MDKNPVVIHISSPSLINNNIEVTATDSITNINVTAEDATFSAINNLNTNVIPINSEISDSNIKVIVDTQENFQDSPMLSTDNLNAIESITNTIIRQGYSPFVSEETGTWWEYNDSKGQFIDTGYAAGTQGFTPISESTLTELWSQKVFEEV